MKTLLIYADIWNGCTVVNSYGSYDSLAIIECKTLEDAQRELKYTDDETPEKLISIPESLLEDLKEHYTFF